MATTNSKTGPFFCKLLIGDDYDDSASIFQIPYHFVKSYGDVLPSHVKLKCGESGKCWRVAIEKFRDHYFFTDGWKIFAEDADIKSLEYISFKFVGLSDPKKDLNSGDGVKRAKNLKSPVPDVVKRLKFVKKFKAHHEYRMGIPVKFAIDTGIAENRKVLLQDDKGRKWEVRVTDKNIGDYSMSKGWIDFVRGNNVVSGNTLSFEFLGNTNIVKTQVIKEGTNNEDRQLGYVKRKVFPSDTEQENDYVSPRN